jgi:cytochrome c oxidase subunit 3
MSLKNIHKATNELHPFHLVSNSVLPILTSLFLSSFLFGFILLFHPELYYGCTFVGRVVIQVSFFGFVTCLVFWFYCIILEADAGHHTFEVQRGIRLGMCLFIISEIMFFFSFFWAFFHCSLSPAIGIGCIWPPIGIVSLDPWGLPLWNTTILLSSGVTVTVAHRAVFTGDYNTAVYSLTATLFYAILFTTVQLFEYNTAPFFLNDGIFGSLFYMLTGFHGIHVVVGTLFLIVCHYRLVTYKFTIRQHLGLECGIWYWHFVDVVWLFLFISIYLWGI